MRSLSIPVFSFLLVILLGVVTPASGSPRPDTIKRKDGDGGGDDGGGGSGSGIPTVDGAKNTVCKPWYAIQDAIMGGIYHGRCGDPACAAVRLAFHDAGAFSLTLQAAGRPNGGADGSMLVDPNEVLRPDNNVKEVFFLMQNIVSLFKPLPAEFNVSPGDVLHLACPGGPTIKTYIGWKAPKNIAPNGLLPNTNSPVKVLTDHFADMSFSIRELMALIGAHTACLTVLDVNFSHNATTQKDYNRFVGKQDNWGREYADVHEKMSLLGVNKSTLTDCTEVLPQCINLKDLSVSSSNSGKQPTDPVIDPVKLEAAIQKYRSIWL
ncbi:heme peroxidase [Mycena olivaceomarginata]|nr:heme peroxidase [Mycena olivaceomarginata]